MTKYDNYVHVKMTKYDNYVHVKITVYDNHRRCGVLLKHYVCCSKVIQIPNVQICVAHAEIFSWYRYLFCFRKMMIVHFSNNILK